MAELGLCKKRTGAPTTGSPTNSPTGSPTPTPPQYVTGWNNYGQLGDGSTVDKATPVPALSPYKVTQVNQGCAHLTVFLTDTGAWYATGGNAYGQIGDGSTVNKATPVLVMDSNTVTQVAAGHYHTVFLTDTGATYAVGRNNYGNLGDGTTTNRATPVLVMGSHTVTQVAAGYGHTVFLVSGATYAAGWNANGELGSTTKTQDVPYGIPTPVRVMSAYTVVEIFVGAHNTFFLLDTGAMFGTGFNFYGQLGDGAGAEYVSTPVHVMQYGGHKVTQVAAGVYHAVFLTDTGATYAAGLNNYGQLGDGSTVNRAQPVLVMGSHTVTQVAAGSYHTVFLTDTGATYAAGYNAKGNLGDGTTTDRATPVLVMDSGTGVTQVAAGIHHTVFLTV